MTNKGEKKQEKRHKSTKVMKINRKENVWSIKTRAGPHTRKTSVPLGFVLRNLIGVTDNLKETKFILNNNKVILDGKTVKDYKKPVGLFDLITLEENKKDYRIIFDKKGRFIVDETTAEKKKTKMCKVVGKKTVKGKKTRLITNDGRSIDFDKDEIKVGDTIKIELPTQKVLENIKLEKGNKVYIVAGKHAGETARIKEIVEGNIKNRKMIKLKGKEKDFQTVANNIFVIGK